MSRRSAVLALLSMTLFAACGGGGGEAAAPPSPPSPPPLPAGWERLADMPTALAKFGAVAVGGKIYVVGGYDTRRSLFVYDIAANSWSSGPALPRGSDNVAALERGGTVWALGGEAGAVSQVFDPATSTWSTGPALPSLRFASAAASLNGNLHLVGGWNASNSASASLASHDVLASTASSWAAAPPMATARNAAGAAALGGKLYVVGGRAPGIRANDQSSLSSVEIFDPTSAAWAAGPALPTARGSLGVAALGGKLYAMGGESTAGSVSDAVERFDPATNTWAALPAMPYRSHGLGLVAVGTALYVMGGFTGASDAVGSESAALYRYTPPN